MEVKDYLIEKVVTWSIAVEKKTSANWALNSNTSNEKFLTKTGKLGPPQNGQKQVYDLQHNALTSLVHFVIQLYKVN